MKPFKVIILLLLFFPAFSFAKTVDDVNVPDTIKIKPNSPTLHLNGASLRRTFMVVKTYVGALYLEHKSSKPEEILAKNEYRRMLFHVLLRKVTAHKVGRALRDALVINISPEEQRKLGSRIKKFVKMFKGKLKDGDEVKIDYIPGKGSRVEIGNVDKGVIPGKDFSDAMLQVWIGENPVGTGFKDDILGIKPDPNQYYGENSDH